MASGNEHGHTSLKRFKNRTKRSVILYNRVTKPESGSIYIYIYETFSLINIKYIICTETIVVMSFNYRGYFEK